MTDNESEWEPVNSGDHDNYELAFVNVNQEEESLELNIDGEDKELATDSVEGVYDGLNDISAADNPKPSLNHLVKNDSQERTYALGNVATLKRQFEDIEEGQDVKIEFQGVGETDEGLPYFKFQVYTRA